MPPFTRCVVKQREFETPRENFVAEFDLNHVYDTYFQRIHRAALMLTGSPWEADDLTQETFAVAARSGHGFEGRSHIYTWLYGILLNLDRRRRRSSGMQRRKLREVWSGPKKKAASSELPSSSSVEVAEWKRSLWSYVAQLPDGQREALVLRFAEQLHYEEIAEVLSCPLGTVKSRLFNGLVNLKKLLMDQQDVIRDIPQGCWQNISHVS